jgi:hypothetical protein
MRVDTKTILSSSLVAATVSVLVGLAAHSKTEKPVEITQVTHSKSEAPDRFPSPSDGGIHPCRHVPVMRCLDSGK